MTDIVFPTSSAPGQRAGEGEGWLRNAHVIKEGDNLYWRRAPGLTNALDTTKSTPRGLFECSGFLFLAYSGSMVRVAGNTPTTLSGTLTGTDQVTFAANLKEPTPDMVVCRSSGGAYVVTVIGGTVAAHPDTDLPTTVNSVSSLGPYHIYTDSSTNKIWASDLNSTAQNALSYTTAEARPDGLIRGMTFGNTFFAFGTDTIEPYKDVGGSPFPLARHTTVIPVGLLAFGAVAGGQQGWDRNLFFVAHDGTVRELRGYNPVRVSTPAVERFIASSTASTLTAFVYTCPAGAFWVLTSDAGTWEYNTTTASWSERQSATGTGWRAKHSAKFGGLWFVQDTLSTSLLRVDRAAYQENGATLTWTIQSAGLKEYPARYTVGPLLLDFTKGLSTSVSIRWSQDAGATWNGPITRSLSHTKAPVRLNRLGIAPDQGVRVELSISDNLDFSFMGASVPLIQERKP